MSKQELETLAREIAAAEGVSLDQARQIARAQADTLIDYARSWDHLAAEARPYEYVTVRTA